MNIAVIIAGGVGHRFGQDIPKQFINVYDKPIIIYTLESFQKHPLIDEILVVCLSGWEEVLNAYAKQFNITKLKYIIRGGNSGQESIKNGVDFLKDKISDNDIVIIHDGIRPIIDTEVLTDVIQKAKQFGNAVTSMPYYEQIFIKTDENTTNRFIPRDTIKRVSTPQAYNYKLLYDKYQEAFETNKGIGQSHYTNTMMVELGVTLHFAIGSDKNIKITTKDDLELFKAYLKMKGRTT